jgi:hypothetical protein
MPHKPGHKREPGDKTYKGPGGSAGGPASKVVPPLKRVVDPGFMKKAKTKPVAAKPTRFDNRKVAK